MLFSHFGKCARLLMSARKAKPFSSAVNLLASDAQVRIKTRVNINKRQIWPH